MNRHFYALFLTGALTLSVLSGCGGQNGGGTPSLPPQSGTPAPVETVEPESTPVPTLPPAAVETPAGGSDVQGQNPPESIAPAPKPQPTKDPAPAPTPADGNSTPTPALPEEPAGVVQAVWDRIEAEVELPSFMDMDSEVRTALYGIDSGDLEDYIGKVPLMNVQATEIFIARVKEGRMDAVRAGVEQRQADLQAQWSSYLPEQLELVENYKLVTNGDYLLFAVSYEADQLVQIFNDCTN